MTNGEFDELLKKLQITFNDLSLLKQAFIHRSFLNETKSELLSNERLEFLGDSVLSFITSTYLYNLRKEDAEGELTSLRAYIVKTKSLAEAAKKLELGKYLKLSKGEELGGGRANAQLLANTYEALIGAIFLDQGIETVRDFIHNNLLALFESEIKFGPPKDAKSQLQEVVQEKFKQSPLYKILDTKGPDHAKEFVVGVFIQNEKLGLGKGNNKQEAEEQAAKKALAALEKLKGE